MDAFNSERFKEYYYELMEDIYPQPVGEDEHYNRAKRIIDDWMRKIHIKDVLDVGCGEGFCQELFEAHKVFYTGISLGEDVEMAILHERNVKPMDFNFLDYPDDYFDMIFSRHSLEHSPFPIITLMEWHRVSKKWLGIVVPNPKTSTYFGRNHYYMPGHPSHLRWILRRAGWKVVYKHYDDFEYCLMCEKLPRIGYEGWADIPLEWDVLVKDREDEEGLWR